MYNPQRMRCNHSKIKFSAPSEQMDRLDERNRDKVTERLRQWWSEQTVRDRKTDKQNDLIYPDGLLDRRQDGWMETDRSIVSERRIDSDTLTLWGQQNTEGYSYIIDNNTINTLCHFISTLYVALFPARNLHITLYQKWQRWFVSKSVQFHKHLACYHNVISMGP